VTRRRGDVATGGLLRREKKVCGAAAPIYLVSGGP
jgi:hypothetical protein